MEATQRNAKLLREVDYDFQNFIQAQAGSTLAFGSEFLSVEQLRPLLCQHSGVDEELAEILITGMPYRDSREEIIETERETEVIAMPSGGNNKSAQQEPAIVEQLFFKDVVHMDFQW